MNTAPLTGEPRHVPIRLVTVDNGGALVEVTEHIGCESTNTQVLQVSGMCANSRQVCTCVQSDAYPSSLLYPREQLLDTRSLVGGTTDSTSFVPTSSLQHQLGRSSVTPAAPA